MGSREDEETHDLAPASSVLMVVVAGVLVAAVAVWSTAAYYSLGNCLRASCEQWSEEQPEGIGREISDRLPPCPPSLDLARAPGSGFIEDTGMLRLLTCSFFHRGADTCFRQTNITK